MMKNLLEAKSKELKADPRVLGILLFGSWARGNNRPNSDVDLLVIVKDGFKRTVEYHDTQAFEITYTTERGALVYWDANPNDAVEFWNSAQVLFDRDGTIARLQQAGEAFRSRTKPPLSPEVYEHLAFDARDQLVAITSLATSDPITAKLLLSIKIAQLTELYFDTRQQWTPPPKQRLDVLKESDFELYDLFASYYTETSLAEQIEIARRIVAIVFDQRERL